MIYWEKDTFILPVTIECLHFKIGETCLSCFISQLLFYVLLINIHRRRSVCHWFSHWNNGNLHLICIHKQPRHGMHIIIKTNATLNKRIQCLKNDTFHRLFIHLLAHRTNWRANIWVETTYSIDENV